MTHEFRVWAPNASSVDVMLEGARHTMTAREGGWFVRAVDNAGPGSRYAYALDGGPPRPDPRSPFQRDGVDGPSTIVDHEAFRWTDGAWRGIHLPSAVLYELHVGTFTPEGTFEGVIDKLPYLVDLGVDAIELMPVAAFSGSRGWGYDGVDLFAPHHDYGGPDGLKRLVDAAHAQGLAVILDVVYNHLGPSGNYLSEFGPYFTDRYSTPWGTAVNFDGPGSDEVRAFVVDNALMWLRDYHIDGLRLDAVHAILDASATHILEEIGVAVESLAGVLGRALYVIVESDLNDPRLVARREVGGYAMDAQWSDDFHHALHTILTGERDGYYSSFGRVEQLATAYQRAFVYAGEHDPHRARRHGRAPTDVAAWRFFAYAQNHDQVGNRARGERLSQLVSIEQLQLAAALVLTAPFVPMLFMGEEWGASTPFQYFTDHADPELGRAVSEGRRREFAGFGWRPEEVPDPQEAATFERSKLCWEEAQAGDHAALRRWHQRLIALRRSHPSFGPGRFEDTRVEHAEEGRWLVVRRGSGRVVANLRAEPQEVDGVALGPWGVVIDDRNAGLRLAP